VKVFGAGLVVAALLISTTAAGRPVEYGPELVSLDLKDADLHDVLRYFSSIGGFNVVLEPGVRGSVTVRLRDVPWTEAMELVLRANDLWFDLEDNVIWIAPRAVLLARLRAEAELADAREAAAPLFTIVVQVSYARAEEIAQVVAQTALTSRGTVVVDSRTNRLIITDVDTHLPRAKLVVRSIDR